MESLKRILGMIDEGKRIYRIHEEIEVQREEFAYCQLMHQIVFGKDGYVETLGPTWSMVNDPRFFIIENEFIINRHAIFGGDARLGKQYINDDGTFSSSIGDLEQYAEIIGEGRNFHNVLTHPNENCPIRRWLERIFKGYTLVKPHLALKCACPEDQKVDPRTFKDASNGTIWNLIHQECPNRGFDRNGTATAYGNLMYKLIRADLIGLIHDYAETPYIDSYIYLRDNGVVVNAENISNVDPHGTDHQRVLQEIDILEQALTHRATLRATAAKILKSMKPIESMLNNLTEPDGEKLRLTDLESDGLLKAIYTSKWPDDKLELMNTIMFFLGSRANSTYAQRQENQLRYAKEYSQDFIHDLMTGRTQPINHYTEPVREIPEDQQESEVMRLAAIYDSLTKNPLKGWLFSEIYAPAELEGDLGVLDILQPIFDPNYDLTEEGYNNILRSITRQARSLRVLDPEDVVPRGTDDTGVVPKMEVREVSEKHSDETDFVKRGMLCPNCFGALAEEYVMVCKKKLCVCGGTANA